MQGLLCLLLLTQPQPAGAVDDQLLTVAERSEYQATSRHADVLALCRALAEKSPIVRLKTLGTSREGRELPLLILADPPVDSPQQARRSGKLIVYLQGNIHAGEVCGKEALLILARELACAEDRALFKNLVVAIAPLLNADGNERISPENRPHQIGPAQGVGCRENADGFDLNRDHVKLESPEVRAIVKLLNEWDPAVVIDTHTTNGSFHRYAITYDSPRHPATDAEVLRYARDELLPEIGRRVEQASGYKAFFYGNFGREQTTWETYPALPRYNAQYVGLRNRIGILCESYAYAPFKERVQATRAFVLAGLRRCAEQKAYIEKLLLQADKHVKAAGENPRPEDRVAIRVRPARLEGAFRIAGFVEVEDQGRHVATDQPQDYPVEYLGRSEAVLDVSRPWAYLIPTSAAGVIERLHRHGVALEVLREDIELDVELYAVEGITRQEKEFQKHHLVELAVAPRNAVQRFSAGTVVAKCSQPLGNLLVLLLEPQSEDGLCAWNFLDDRLAAGADYPIARLAAEQPLLTAALSASPEGVPPKKKRITFEAISGPRGVNFSGSPAGGIQWLADGEHYLQIKGGQLRKIHAATGRSMPFFDPAPLRRSLEALPPVRNAAARLVRPGTLRLDPAHTAALFEHENDLYYAEISGQRALRLTSTPEPEELSEFSPDGKFVAFVRDYDLHVVDVASGRERALTTGGDAVRRNGMADWVYYEEVYNRNWKAYRFSPDSQHLAFMHFDDTHVPEFPIVNGVPVRAEVERERYPKAGEPNPNVRLGIVSVAGGGVRWIEPADYPLDGLLLTQFGWKGDSQVLWFCTQDRTQTWLDLHFYDLSSGACRRLFRERTGAWVEVLAAPWLLKDGSFLWLSDRDGWRHLYHYTADGQLLRQVTAGEWEVRTLHEVNEAEGWLYFSATRDSHLAENFYRAGLDGQELARLTPAGGSHRVVVAPGGTYFAATFSNCRQPARVELRRGNGELARVLDTNPVPLLDQYEFGPIEFVQIPARDGFVLEGYLIKPPDFDPARRYPVWFSTYGGPRGATVQDSWQGGRTYDQALASMGIVVFHCNPRSASGKGSGSAWTAYRQLGVQELKDIEDAIGWLTSQPYIDASRIGISGHSYGGYFTAYAMTHSKLFCAGIAGAPVTDWRNYDTIYTERYMLTPQENPEGYKASSVVAAAKNLHGKLLLLHGGIDDNVHLQNTLQLAEALQAAEKDFELMIYPQARHGLYGPHYRRLTVEFIRRSLGLKSGQKENE
jgi:dipeptidyl aminopeptidase/acylaminoacyl peptidase